METIVLGHHVSNMFWMSTIGKKLPLAQEDAMKHEKYAVVVAKHWMPTTTAHSMAFSLNLMSNNLRDNILERVLNYIVVCKKSHTSEPQTSIGDPASINTLEQRTPASIWRRLVLKGRLLY